MTTQANRVDSNYFKALRSIFQLLRLSVLFVLALTMTPVALADTPSAKKQLLASAPSSEPRQVEIQTGFKNSTFEAPPILLAIDVVKKPSQNETDVKIAAQSILNMMILIQSNNAQLSSVKVPSYNYLPILQEMQNRNARFLLPGAEIPVTARIVFQLKAEEAGLSQTVYFP